MKGEACAKAGIYSVVLELPEDVPQEPLEYAVRELNENPDIHGILVQLPLPAHINEEAVLECIHIDKDVDDGFHPLNMGKLCMKGREPTSVACTPKGCIELLKRSNISIEKKKAVVVGRSNIVGMPAALLLMKLDATVTVVHSRTPDPQSIVREADIIIADAGQPELIKREWIKPGAAVVDVGYHQVSDSTKKRGYRTVGDVEFQGVREVAGWITPVLGNDNSYRDDF